MAYSRLLVLDDCRVIGTAVGACRCANEKALLLAIACAFHYDSHLLFVSSNYIFYFEPTDLASEGHKTRLT